MQKVSEHIEKILKNLPKSPWVYQMKDKWGKVMYVGKAKSLTSRVKSYFVKTTELSLAKRQMVGKIADIEIITCTTEVEALVLETNLIKHLTPKYNILMKDDKNLAYIKITNSPVPELIKTRQKIRDGAEYFGPYVSAVENSVRALRRIFRIRNCRMKFALQETPAILSSRRDPFQNHVWENNNQNLLSKWKSDSSALLRNDKNRIKITDKAGRTPPCMDYYIGLCPAPCLLEDEKVGEHTDHINSARQFLSWESLGLFDKLEADMREKAKIFEFEEAQKIKETLESLKGLYERQKVRDIVEGDIDIFIQYEKYDKVYVALTQVRSSQIVGVFRHEVSSGLDENILVQFLMRQYIENEEWRMKNEEYWADLPGLLLLREEIKDTAFLEFLRENKIALEYPKIWPKNDLLDFSLTQLREYAYKRELATLENKTLTRDHMTHVLDRLGYPYQKKWEIIFECYDISHTDGHFTYASRVSIVNGKPDPSRYKKYKIKTLEDGDIDDFASHREVMMRRTIEGIEQGNFPHLIIIDWGKGQLSSALSGTREGIYHSVNREFDYQTLPLCSIAKREEEIFLPGNKAPILFEKWAPELMVLQKARDESHRFSITANKSARMKSMKKNILEEIPGIGPVTRKKLLKLAGNLEEIKNIPPEEIEKIATKAQIIALQDHGII